MTSEPYVRKLTAILSADVKGYSLLMANDDHATVRILTAYRAVMTRIIRAFRGRVVDSPGDNLLAEFPSVLDGVGCAVQIQSELKLRNRALPEKRRMKFRIGINLGDVIQEGERIYGDGVNIAARIEGLAEPEGICISGPAYDQVGNKVGLEYEYLGEHKVKNIIKPVRVYKILMAPQLSPREKGGEKSRDKEGSRLGRWKTAFAGLLLLVGVAGGALTMNLLIDESSVEEPALLEMPKREGPGGQGKKIGEIKGMQGGPQQGENTDITARIEKIREALFKSEEDLEQRPAENLASEKERPQTGLLEDERRKVKQRKAPESDLNAAQESIEKEDSGKRALFGEPEGLKTGMNQSRPQVARGPVQPDPSDLTPPKVRLRSEPTSVGLFDLRSMLKRFNFFVLTDNESGIFHNDFQDLGNDVVMDKRTGLMWEKGGSSSPLYYDDAVEYVEKLNKKGFAGHKDWRVPTLEELCSLLQSQIKEDEVFPGADGWRPPSLAPLLAPEGSPEMRSVPNSSHLALREGLESEKSVFPLTKPCWTCDMDTTPHPNESFRQHYVADLFTGEAYGTHSEYGSGLARKVFVKAVRTAAR